VYTEVSKLLFTLDQFLACFNNVSQVVVQSGKSVVCGTTAKINALKQKNEQVCSMLVDRPNAIRSFKPYTVLFGPGLYVPHPHRDGLPWARWAQRCRPAVKPVCTWARGGALHGRLPS